MTKKPKPTPATDLPTWVYRAGMTLSVTVIMGFGGYFLSGMVNGIEDISKRTNRVERKVDKIEVIQGEQVKKIDDYIRRLPR